MKSDYEFKLKILEDIAELKRRLGILETGENVGGLYCSNNIFGTITTSILTAVGAVRSTSQIYVDTIKVIGRVTGTNNAGNNYDIQFRSYSDEYSDGGLFTDITALTNTNGWGLTFDDRSFAVSTANPTRYGLFAVNVTKNGSPGTLTLIVNIYYRIAGL